MPARIILPHPACQTCLRECQERDVDFLTARVSADDLPTIHALEDAGFHLMDQIVYYRAKLSRKKTEKFADNLTVREALSKDMEEISNISYTAFREYFSHYHADPRLDKEKVGEGYAEWACSYVKLNSLNSTVLIAEKASEMAGFAAVQVVAERAGDGILFAVRPSIRGQGVFQELLLASMNWLRHRGCREMTYSTQINNYVVQRTLVRWGFRLERACYTFHKWF